MKIRGRTVMTPVPKSDWNQADPKKADYIKNKPTEMEAVRGYSAYQVAVMNGFDGTEEEWLRSLRGAVGSQGEAGPAGPAGPDGPAGANGKDGYTPVKGVDYYTEEDKETLKQEILEEVPGAPSEEVTKIDFSNFQNGSFTEVVDGETVTHTVEMDSEGRPSSIDGAEIVWGEANKNSDPMESTEYPGCYYRDADGENEWINPPMVFGEVYRTSERYNGKAVYKACIHKDNVTGTSGTTSSYQHSLMLAAYPHVIGLSGVVSSTYDEMYEASKYGYLKAEYYQGELSIYYLVTEAMAESSVDIIVKFTLD